MPLHRWTVSVAAWVITLSLLGCAEPRTNPRADAGAPDGLALQAAILDADGCDPIAPYDCGFPFPSNVYLVPDARMVTGHHVHIPNGTIIPVANSQVVTDLTLLHESDGFSPGQQAVIRLAGATSTGLADAEHIGDSLLPDSPTVLLDADTGEKVPHWAELDMRSQGVADPSGDTDAIRRALLIRPAQRLRSAHRYIVAVRDVVDVNGMPIEASPVFAALRDQTASTLPTVELRRATYADIFARLEAAGVARDTLQIAWDFSTSSEENNTRRLRFMRDTALAELGAGNSPAYVIDSMVDNPPGDPNIRRILRGHVTVPMYLSQVDPGGTMTIDANHLPVRQGSAAFKFTVVIPNSTVPGPWPIVQFGHGLFGGVEDVVDARISTMAAVHGAVFVGHDWLGLTRDDLDPLAQIILDGAMEKFATVPDRGQQAMLNAMLIQRMMRHGLPSDPLSEPDGVPTIDPSRSYFFGASLGGIYGSTYMAISPDVVRGAIGVPGQSFDLLLPRSQLFDEFLIGLAVNWGNREKFPLILGVAQMLWDRVEPTGYSHHLRADPLPGTPQKEIFMLSALGDHLVSNYGSLVMARSIGLPVLEPAIRTRYGLGTVTSPTTGGAWLELDYGLPTVPIANLPATAGADPHSTPFGAPTVQAMIYEFLSTGTIENLCTGLCDPY